MPTIPEPLVVRVMREYREALDAKELDAMRAMTERWLQIERRLDADVAALALEIERRVKAGEVVTQQIVWRMERYQQIKGKLQDEVKRYNQTYLVGAIEQQQREFGMFGVQSSRDTITASYLGSSRMAPYFPIVNRDQIETMVGFLGNGSPLMSLLKRDYPDAIHGLTSALVQGIARGYGAAQLAREMMDGAGMGLERALLIARTEMARTYRNASIMQYRESNVVRGFQRLVKKSHACMACLALDGETFAVEDDFYDHPRGNCNVIPLVKGVQNPSWQKGLEWFKALTPEEQRARMGAEKYDLWRSGQIRLSDFARVTHNAEWGDSPRVATIAELNGG